MGEVNQKHIPEKQRTQANHKAHMIHQ